jgi:Zn-dependent protease
VKITSIQGIPIRIHWSFWILLGTYGLFGLRSGGVVGLFESVGMMSVLFLSVVLHELGHALMARRYRVKTAHITLYPFGGIAALRSEPKSPRAEFWIALAGPFVNIGLMALGALAWLASGWIPFGIFAGLNLVLAIFNLIPAFPMDGGRVLRAALSPVLGWWKASRVAILIGRVFALAFLVFGLYWASFNLIIVGAFLLFATGMERRKLKMMTRQVQRGKSNSPYVPRWSIHPPSM